MFFKNSKSTLGFDDTFLVIFGIVVNTHTIMGVFYPGALFEVDLESYVIKWIGNLIIVAIVWIVTRALFMQLVAKYPKSGNLKKRFLAIPLFLVPFFLLVFTYFEYVEWRFDWPYPNYKRPHDLVQLITGLLIFLLNIVYYEALYLFVEFKDTKLKEEQLKKERITTQLINLQNQINPHFLFNCFSTLMHLIDEDEKKSKEFVFSLSNLYVRNLDVSNKNLIPLNEELSYINAYADLLKKRHGKNLKFKFDIPKDLARRMVVPLSIQVGIENAVKHNIVSMKKPLNINISATKEFIIIANNLQRKELRDPTTQTGLANINNRYKLIADKAVVTNESAHTYELKIPLLN